MATAWWEVPSVEQFRSIAGRFVALLDARGGLAAAELLQGVHPLLPALYAAGLALPVKPDEAYADSRDDLGPPDPDPVKQARHHARWTSLHDSLQQQIGVRWNFYQEVFDPYAEPPEPPVTGSLADDLSDTYLDLTKGLDFWARGRRDEAVREWRCGFEYHWGEHVTGALRAIRTLATTHDLGFAATVSPDV